MKLKAVYFDEREVEPVVVGARAQTEFERRYNLPYDQSTFNPPGDAQPRAEWLYFLCWAAMHYAGREPEADFDAWLNDISDVELVPGEVNPTRRARRPAKS